MQAQIMRRTGGACLCARTTSHVRFARPWASGFERRTPGCAWVCACVEVFPIATRLYRLCDGTVVCAVMSPRGRRHERRRRRLRQGYGAYGPNAARCDHLRGCCCRSWLFCCFGCVASYCRSWWLYLRPSACALQVTAARAGALRVHLLWPFFSLAALEIYWAQTVSSFAHMVLRMHSCCSHALSF
jgi:hypothetical protein